MSFREKSAWITLVTVLVCFGVYFSVLVMHIHARRAPASPLFTLHWLLLSVAALAVLQLGAMFVAARTTPKDGRAAADERERLIQLRSQSLGYHVLTVLALLLFVPIHFRHSALDMANFALLAVVVSVMTVAVAQIVMFRRGY